MNKQQRIDINALHSLHTDWHDDIAAGYAETVRHLDALRRDVRALHRLRSVPFREAEERVATILHKIAKREGWK